MSKQTLFVNFFGGPGVGKSALARSLCAKCSFVGIDTVYVPEFAQERVLVNDIITLQDQAFVTSTQRHRCWVVNGKYDLATTDSPFPLGLLYGKSDEYFKKHILNQFSTFRNFNVYVTRNIPYVQNGRYENKDQAVKKDNELLLFLDDNNITYITVENHGNKTTEYLYKMVMHMLRG